MASPARSFVLLLLLAVASFGGPTFKPLITEVGADSVTVQTGAHAGMKESSPDENGDTTQHDPVNIKKFSINKLTTIVVNGLPGTATDLKPGMVVDVRAATDPTAAEAITANSIPPARPTPPPSSKEVKKPQAKVHQRLLGNEVIEITAERITFGEPGTQQARAYLIGPTTQITLNGDKATAADIRPLMQVKVSTSDGTTASTIDAKDTK